jgi:alpha-glucuronidase
VSRRRVTLVMETDNSRLSPRRLIRLQLLTVRTPVFVAILLLIPAVASAEDGHAAWLRYAPIEAGARARISPLVPETVVVLGDAAPLVRAREELARGVKGTIAKEVRAVAAIPAEAAIVLGTVTRLREQGAPFAIDRVPGHDGYAIETVKRGAAAYTVIAGESERAVLYGVFAYLRRLALGQLPAELHDRSTPAVPIRWLNHWDNVDGTIERGYGGRSLFWEGGKVRDDLGAVNDYGRLLASLGINGLSINNVNANTAFLTPEFLPQIARVAETLRPWGVQVALAVDFASPQKIGKLATSDPLDAGVIAWWKSKVDEIYGAVPDLAGIVLKADSEGRVGPSAYNRTHADAANVIARALKPHGGVFFYRGFVYDHKMDWRNLKNDRARAAYDNFIGLDGRFDDNVIVQIKHGPIDFQVREPVSPLFGALKNTNEAIELQITQEYFGQGRHTVFLVPMWKEALDFDMKVRGTASTPVKAILAGKVWSNPNGGFVGVSNAGRDPDWFGNHLSQANLYGFGRLAWDPDASSKQIADDWTRLTFGGDSKVVEAIADIQLKSWRVFENYTGPLGLQTLTDIVGNHYGVAVDASERNGWGQWHRADENGVGMDRSVKTGTGYIGQYSEEVAPVFESLNTTPDDLVLFMHHLPYTYRLHAGKTVIQYIYDSHYEGADAVEAWVRIWKTLEGKIDPERYAAVLKQLEYQAGQAVVWRDAVTRWFHRTSKIPDSKGRVGTYPGRMEAESATLDGYTAAPVTPWEAGSGDGAVECKAQKCSATFPFSGAAGRYDVIVQYFDVNTGAARYTLRVPGSGADAGTKPPQAEWIANDRFPTRKLDGGSSTRFILPNVQLQPGDRIVVEGMPDGEETAALDYVEVRRARQ